MSLVNVLHGPGCKASSRAPPILRIIRLCFCVLPAMPAYAFQTKRSDRWSDEELTPWGVLDMALRGTGEQWRELYEKARRDPELRELLRRMLPMADPCSSKELSMRPRNPASLFSLDPISWICGRSLTGFDKGSRETALVDPRGDLVAYPPDPPWGKGRTKYYHHARALSQHSEDPV